MSYFRRREYIIEEGEFIDLSPRHRPVKDLPAERESDQWSLVDVVMLTDILLEMVVLHFQPLPFSVEPDGCAVGAAAAVVGDGYMIPYALGDFIHRQHADGIMREAVTEAEVEPVVTQQ